MRSLLLFKPILIWLALTPGSSMRMQIALAVSQTSTGGTQAPAITGNCSSVASCRTENNRPTRSVRRFSSIRSRPAGPTFLTIDPLNEPGWLSSNGAVLPEPRQIQPTQTAKLPGENHRPIRGGTPKQTPGLANGCV